MKKIVSIFLSLLLILIFIGGCAVPQVQNTTQSSTTETGKFTLLISDEPNDIGDFEVLNVSISKIGIQKANDNDTWIEEVLNPPQIVDLVKLQGDNAIDVFHSDNLTAGDYSKVFIYVDNVEGRLIGAEDDTTVKLPSGKLQISKPFSISEDEEVNFIYDITVVKAGESGKYILKPQISASGADKTFKNVKDNSQEINQQSDIHKNDNKGKNSTGKESKEYPSTTPEEGIFTLLISDEPNDIGDFKELNVTISKIGVQKAANGDDSWIEEELNPIQTVDLVDLQGDNATIVFSDNLTVGDYAKVFIYVDEAEGILTADPDNVTAVKLPGGKLQLSKPFSINEDDEVNFVYDITVIKTGSGKYILKPQISASGVDKSFKDISDVQGNEQKHTKQKYSRYEGTLGENNLNVWDVTIEDKPDIKLVDTRNAVVEGTLASDQIVKITGILDGNTIMASQIIVKEIDEEEGVVEGTTEVQDFEETGIIKSIKANKWTVQIGEELKTINVSRAKITGSPLVEAKATIIGTIEDDIIKVISIVITSDVIP